jgi:hypothetical protein
VKGKGNEFRARKSHGRALVISNDDHEKKHKNTKIEHYPGVIR